MPFFGLISGFRTAADTLLYPVRVTSKALHQFFQTYQAELIKASCGCMLGSAAVFPTWYNMYLESGRQDLLLLDTAVYTASLSSFVWMKLDAIVRNAYTLAGLTTVGVYFFLVTDKPLDQLIPVLPLLFSVGTLATICAGPTAQRIVQELRGLFFDQRTAGSDGGMSMRSNLGTADPASVRSIGSYGYMPLDPMLDEPGSAAHAINFSLMGPDLETAPFAGRLPFHDLEMGIYPEDTLSISSSESSVSLLHIAAQPPVARL